MVLKEQPVTQELRRFLAACRKTRKAGLLQFRDVHPEDPIIARSDIAKTSIYPAVADVRGVLQ
jgi:hypothetical protein